MNLNVILVAISSVLTFGCFVPYLIDMINHKTKPRIISWFIWSVLTGIACVASLSEHQYSTAILLLASSLGTLSIVVFGWKGGDKEIGNLDTMCLIGATVGLILWIVFNSPAIAVLATIAIDFIGGIPTIVHAWKKPDEETWLTFGMSFLGALCTLLAIESWHITGYAFPLYLVIINMVFTLTIIFRKKRIQTKKH